VQLSIPRYDPLEANPPRTAAGRAVRRIIDDLRGTLGLRRAFRIDGVYYKETGTLALWRAVLHKNGGVKEYRVTYPDGSKQYIHCTTQRIYADPMGPLLLPQFLRVSSMIRPGSRVLCMPGGTGYAGAWLGRHVGQSGAVVSIDADKESVLFAQKRYGGSGSAPDGAPAPGSNIAFEEGSAAALRGEIDGAFDVVLSVTHIPGFDDSTLLPELWRVTRPGGWMLIVRAAIGRHKLAEELQTLVGAPTGGKVEVLSRSDEVIRVALVRKPSDEDDST